MSSRAGGLSGLSRRPLAKWVRGSIPANPPTGPLPSRSLSLDNPLGN